jgi:hypothetical protein
MSTNIFPCIVIRYDDLRSVNVQALALSRNTPTAFSQLPFPNSVPTNSLYTNDSSPRTFQPRRTPFYLHEQYKTTVYHSYHSIVMSSLIRAQTSPLFTTLNYDVRMMLYDLLLNVDLPRLWDGSKKTSYLGLYLSSKQAKDVTLFRCRFLVGGVGLYSIH